MVYKVQTYIIHICHYIFCQPGSYGKLYVSKYYYDTMTYTEYELYYLKVIIPMCCDPYTTKLKRHI